MRVGALFLLEAVISICIWFVYSPEHWLRRVDFGTVSVNDRQVQADIYFGDPAFSEAEAIALVHVADVGDYFLDLGNEKVRVGNRSDYMRLPGGVWCYRSMREGAFIEPLPSRHLNEFRIAASNSHAVTVRF